MNLCSNKLRPWIEVLAIHNKLDAHYLHLSRMSILSPNILSSGLYYICSLVQRYYFTNNEPSHTFWTIFLFINKLIKHVMRLMLALLLLIRGKQTIPTKLILQVVCRCYVASHIVLILVMETSVYFCLGSNQLIFLFKKNCVC